MRKQITVRLKPENKKKEFTKQMYMFNVKFAVVLTYIAIGLMIFSAFVDHVDLTPISYIIPPVWLEVSAYSIFMIRKAEAENKRKYPDVNKTNIEEYENKGGHGRGDL